MQIDHITIDESSTGYSVIWHMADGDPVTAHSGLDIGQAWALALCDSRRWNANLETPPVEIHCARETGGECPLWLGERCHWEDAAGLATLAAAWLALFVVLPA